MTHAAALFGVLVYFLPVLVLWVARARVEREAWELALDVPLAVSVDLLAMLLLARLMPLESAAWALRGVWLAGGAAFIVRDRGKPFRIVRGGVLRGLLVNAGLAAAACVWISRSLSRDWGMWDRGWQVPLVASVRGQTAPFMNVYQPDVPLHYHYTGVALSSVFQAFSLDSIHASYALSLTHDVFFGLIGLTLAGLLYAVGLRKWHLYVLAVLAVILNGPISAFRANGPERGYAFLNYIQMSFRPYVAVAGLLYVGIIGAVVVRLEGLRRHEPASRTLPALAASYVLLTITEEPSAAFLGLGLGVAWFVLPDAIHPKRWVGLATLVALAASLPLAARVFQSSLAAKGTVTAAKLVTPRMPGFELPGLAMTTEAGRRVFAFEFLPLLAICAALVGFALTKPSRRMAAMVALLVVPTAAAILAVLCLELNNYATDAHRYVIAVSFVCPAAAVLALARNGRHASIPAALAIGGLALGAHSTLGWVDGIWRNGADKILGGPEMHQASCRDLVGSPAFERVRPTYVAPSVYWAFVGCRPTFVPGTGNAVRSIKTEHPVVGAGAIHELDTVMVPRDAPMRIVCSAATPDDDAICRYAVAKSSCRRAGSRALVCELPPEARAGLPSH